MKGKVLVLERIHDKAYEVLKEHGYEIVDCPDTNRETIIKYAQGCEALLIRATPFDRSLMESISGVKIISRHGVGLDSIDLQAAKELSIKIANTPLSNVNAVAEHSLALILAVQKQILFTDKLTRNGKFGFRHQLVNQELSGKTVGILGFGKIGKRLSKLLSSFDVNLLVYDPYADINLESEYGVKFTSVEDVLKQADIVSIHTPLLPETYHLINADNLALMKKSAILVNASRGPVIDEKALFEALSTGKIAGAGLDVFEQEPPADDNPLFTLNNVIVTPHSAAFSDAALIDMAYVSAKNIVDYLETGTATYLVE